MKFAYTPFVHSAWHQIFENDNEIKKRINAIDFDASLDGAYGDWEGKEMISIEQLPKRIDEADNSWTGKAIVDPVLKRPFSIHSGELAFLKKKRLPLRRGHFVSWVERLRNSLNKYEQEQRECDQCSKSTTVSKNTTFPNRKIYCRECYLKYLETQT